MVCTYLGRVGLEAIKTFLNRAFNDYGRLLNAFYFEEKMNSFQEKTWCVMEMLF